MRFMGGVPISHTYTFGQSLVCISFLPLLFLLFGLRLTPTWLSRSNVAHLILPLFTILTICSTPRVDRGVQPNAWATFFDPFPVRLTSADYTTSV